MNVTDKASSSSTAATDPSLRAINPPAGNAELAALADRFKHLLAGPPTHVAPTSSSAGVPGANIPRAFGTGDVSGEPFGEPSFHAEIQEMPAPALPRGENLSAARPFFSPATPVSTEATKASVPSSETDSLLGRAVLRDAANELETRPPDESLGAAMLQSFLNQSSTLPNLTSAAATTPASRGQISETVLAETVSRVLVSDPLHDGRREVRIEFARDVLPDTGVRLWRDSGRLHVEFTSSAAIAEQGLKDALPRLGDAIQQRQSETTTPIVTLRLHDLDAGSGSGDGRSRQRYHAPDESEDLA